MFQTVSEKEKQMAERIREDRKAQLVSELAKLQSLKEKEEALLKEKAQQELNQKKDALKTMAEKTQALLNKHHISVSEPKLNLAPQLTSRPVTMSMMSVPPPPLRNLANPNFSVPPPGFNGGIGPKPTFSTFVPTAGAMPVYPMGAEDMDISQGRSRSPSPRRDRRRSRSRSRLAIFLFK